MGLFGGITHLIDNIGKGVSNLVDDAGKGISNLSKEVVGTVSHSSKILESNVKKPNIEDTPEWQRLKWNQEVYNKWKNLFGPIEENVAHYYLTTTPKDLENTIMTGIQKAVKGLHQSISSPDYYAEQELNSLPSELSVGLDDKLNKEKMAFLGSGLFLQNPLIAGVNNAYNDISQANNVYLTLKRQQSMNRNNNIIGGLSAIGQILGRG